MMSLDVKMINVLVERFNAEVEQVVCEEEKK
jgi:hypothetical protein